MAINTENYWTGKPTMPILPWYMRAMPVLIRRLFGNTQPIQPCLAVARAYTIVQIAAWDLYAGSVCTNDAVCKTITPKIYIDQVGYSRFDHANNAYDFGQIKPDSTWQNGKVGDVNPLNPGRAPSNDFFYCTTGAQSTDPLIGCASMVLPSIYNSGNNNPLFTSNYIIDGLLIHQALPEIYGTLLR